MRNLRKPQKYQNSRNCPGKFPPGPPTHKNYHEVPSRKTQLPGPRHRKLDLRSDEAAANKPFWTGGEGPRAENQWQRRATAVSPFECRSALIGAELGVGDEEEMDGWPCLDLMESAVLPVRGRVYFRQRRDRSAASTPTPPGMFSRLIESCPKIEKLFRPELVHNFQYLEQIYVACCEQLAEIISTSDDDEENNEEGKDFTIVFTLPKLREMTFRYLPQLKCICNRGSRMECNSLEKIEIVKCPKLKRIPLLLPHSDNGQLLPPASLKRIEANSKEWWDSLEWDHPNIKNVLEPYVVFAS
ncbi:hypothetical protein LWI28_022105 [Acer negundo]|uniref:Disease resistance protein At4g27190-like leucine-rich repeats domain-containing protein n=1 Tax=Acer negundo TaxID=4023 RepID=A0AAD5J7Q0_ACENE|nr:hypothetical protein LWI28_022105 [Acer negundo]